MFSFRMLACALLLTPVVASQGFENGDFETGDLTGWTVEYASNTTGAPITGWTTVLPTGHPGALVVDDSEPAEPGVGVDIDPYQGQWMAKLNDIDGGKHATRLTTSTVLTEADLFNGGQLQLSYGAVLEDPGSGHDDDELPFFEVRVIVAGSELKTFTADAKETSDWDSVGSNIWHRTETWALDLCSADVGETMVVQILVADCTQGGHGSYAYIDNLRFVNLCAPIVGAINVWAPSAFIPGHSNPVVGNWGFYTYYATDIEVLIFDRWGGLLKTYTKTLPYGSSGEWVSVWDGKVGGVLQPIGEYVWKGTLRNCSNTYTRTDSITLIQ